jgi:hypothetical protein
MVDHVTPTATPTRSQYDAACRYLGLHPPTTSAVATLVVSHWLNLPGMGDKEVRLLQRAILCVVGYHLALEQQDQARMERAS